jgi:hypothetical protein
MAHAREPVELDVVARRAAPQRAQHLAAQLHRLRKLRIEAHHGLRRRLHELAHHTVALGVLARRAALFDLGQAVAQRIHEQLAPRRVVHQVVLQVGIALHHPDVTEHLVEHARRAPRAPLGAQLIEQAPGCRAEQPDHDLAIRERGVVVGDFTQANGLASLRLQLRQRNRNVHGG